MRPPLLIAIILMVSNTWSLAQSWSQVQLESANTARDIPYLSPAEKEVIMYINLARMYPQLFLEFEVRNYVGTVRYGDYLRNSEFKKSLMEELRHLHPGKPYLFNQELFDNAKCFSEELGSSGRQEHARKACAEKNYAECLSFGMTGGKDIAMQLLIDHNVASLGHRKICLDSAYTKIGVSVHDHLTWGTCAVLEFVW
jgi:hypothetical protein